VLQKGPTNAVPKPSKKKDDGDRPSPDKDKDKEKEKGHHDKGGGLRLIPNYGQVRASPT
jgi:hypothetical protein